MAARVVVGRSDVRRPLADRLGTGHLLDTELRVIIIDPTGDFVRLGERREDARADEADRLGAVPMPGR